MLRIARHHRTYYYIDAISLVACSSATGVLHDEFVQADDGQTLNVEPSAGHTALSQSWQSGSSPEAVTSVCLRLFKIGSPTGNVAVAVRAHSGTYGTSSVPTGLDLVRSSEFDVTGLGSGVGNVANYSFALTGWTPDASTNYTIVFDGAGIVGSGINYVSVVIESGAEATHGGNQAQYNGTTWTSVAGTDMVFKIYYASTAGAGGRGMTPGSMRRFGRRGGKGSR